MLSCTEVENRISRWLRSLAWWCFCSGGASTVLSSFLLKSVWTRTLRRMMGDRMGMPPGPQQVNILFTASAFFASNLTFLNLLRIHFVAYITENTVVKEHFCSCRNIFAHFPLLQKSPTEEATHACVYMLTQRHAWCLFMVFHVGSLSYAWLEAQLYSAFSL